VCPAGLLSEGERTELNGLLSVTAGKNRIARTNTWTSLEKGGNIKGNMMLVCTVDSAWEQEKKTKKNMRIQIDVHIPFLESCHLI
jgi:hypothetical protein